MLTLTTDFGSKDPYVAEMKGVIFTITPKANVIDVTHDIDKFDVKMGAFILASVAPYFPKDTIHVAVVDPEVGTDRLPILIQTEYGYFVGPDNGVLILAAQSQGIKHIYKLTNPKYMHSQISNTFHGRDIFAPVAAHLDKGVTPSEFGPEINGAFTPDFDSIKKMNNIIIGEIIHIDSFGNVITNISQKYFIKNNMVCVKFSNVSLDLLLGKNYEQVEPHGPTALIGSHGFLEVSVNRGSASDKYHIKTGDKVQVTLGQT